MLTQNFFLQIQRLIRTLARLSDGLPGVYNKRKISKDNHQDVVRNQPVVSTETFHSFLVTGFTQELLAGVTDVLASVSGTLDDNCAEKIHQVLQVLSEL